MRNSSSRVRLSFAFAAAVSSMSCSVSGPTSPSGGIGDAAAVRDVVVLGDSLAVSPSGSDNFPTVLQERLESGGYRWRVVNAGVNGAVTADGVRRLDSVLTGSTGILVLTLGANDGLRGIPTDAVEQNLTTIIERATARGIRVLLCGMETPPTHGWEYTFAFHAVFPRLAVSHDVPLVPFLLAGVALNPNLNGPDGVHPNSAGARQIANTIWPYLDRVIQASTAVTSRSGR